MTPDIMSITGIIAIGLLLAVIGLLAAHKPTGGRE